MTLPAWPASLAHQPLIDGLALSLHRDHEREQVDRGAPFVQRRGAVGFAPYALTWEMTEGEARAWWAWYRVTLADGTRWWSVPLYLPGVGYQTTRCQFAGTPRLAMPYDAAWRITAELLVRLPDPPSADEVLALTAYGADAFGALIADLYTAVHVTLPTGAPS